jgi:hypothetical protein
VAIATRLRVMGATSRIAFLNARKKLFEDLDWAEDELRDAIFMGRDILP